MFRLEAVRFHDSPELIEGDSIAISEFDIGLGSFDHVGDCGDLLKHGAATWHLWLFGLIHTVAGFALWNKLGPHFGFGSTARPIRLIHCITDVEVISNQTTIEKLRAG